MVFGFLKSRKKLRDLIFVLRFFGLHEGSCVWGVNVLRNSFKGHLWVTQRHRGGWFAQGKCRSKNTMPDEKFTANSWKTTAIGRKRYAAPAGRVLGRLFDAEGRLNRF